MKTLKDKVRYCLEKYSDSRNSDITLTLWIWREFYYDSIIKSGEAIEQNGRMYISPKLLFILPREDNIKRIRAYFQNNKKLYLPTNLEVVRQRKQNEEEWRKQLNYNPELRTI